MCSIFEPIKTQTWNIVEIIVQETKTFMFRDCFVLGSMLILSVSFEEIPSCRMIAI